MITIIILISIFSLLILYFFKKSVIKKQEKFPYVENPILNVGEKNLYEVLKLITQDEYAVFIKIRLIDLLKIKANGTNWLYYKNKVIQKHIDFILCDSKSLKVKLAIELDGETHRAEKQQKKDDFKNKVLTTIGIPILRIEAKSSYNINDIQNKIKNAIK